jgi:hypothetical protein
MPNTAEGNYQRKDVDWLVMLYLSGDNNLSSDMVWAINEIRSAGVPEGFGLTIQYDALAPGAPTKRYKMNSKTKNKGPGTGPFPFPEAVAGTLKDQDAASPEVLADFIRWSVGQFRAPHRMLILSGHGSGMVGDFLTDQQARQEGQPGSMTIRGLSEAIRRALSPPDEKALKASGSPSIRDFGLGHGGPVLHVLGMDSCLMSTLEVATELAKASDDAAELVKYLVASEGFVPNTGWPYGFLLGELRLHIDDITREAEELAHKTKQPPDVPRVLCRHLVEDCEAYYGTYLPAGVSFDIAACDLSKLPEVTSAVRNLTETIALERDEDDVILAHWRAQSFKFEQFTDLYDFCDQLLRVRAARLLDEAGAKSLRDVSLDGVRERLATAGKGEPLIDASLQVMFAIDTAVFAPGRVGIEFQHAHGLSIYFPWSNADFIDDEYRKAYAALAFVEPSGWLTFLDSYVESSRREERPLTRKGAPSVVFPAEEERAGAPRPPLIGNRKYSAGYNKYSAGYNKFLTEMLGGRLPWSMKNPPERVRIPAGKQPGQGQQHAPQEPAKSET